MQVRIGCSVLSRFQLISHTILSGCNSHSNKITIYPCLIFTLSLSLSVSFYTFCVWPFFSSVYLHFFSLLLCVASSTSIFAFFLFSHINTKWNSVSLDPDEDKRDTTIFDGLKHFMLHEMSDEDCQYFKTVTLRNLAKRAQSLKAVRPPRGLSFSLQQQRMLNLVQKPNKNTIYFHLIIM